MRFSAIKLLKCLVVLNVALFAVWQWTSVCHSQQQKGDAAAGAMRADDSKSDQLLRALTREVEALQKTATEKKERIKQLELESNIAAAHSKTADGDAADDDVDVDQLARAQPGRQSSAQSARKQYEKMSSIRPKNEYDVVPWSAFTLTDFFRTDIGVGKEPGGRLRGRHRAEVDLVVNAALDALSSPYGREHFIEGFKRTDRYLGTQYDLLFRNPKMPDEVRRVRMMRALQPLEPGDGEGDLARASTTALRQLHMERRDLRVIVPAVGRPKHLKDFVRHFIAHTLGVQTGGKYTRLTPALSLTVVAMTANLAALRAMESAVKEVCTGVQYTACDVVSEHRHSDWSAAVLAGLQAHANDAAADSIVMVSNMDLRMAKETLDHCRSLADRRKRAVWQIPFQLYNPALVHGSSDVSFAKQAKLSSAAGFWSEDDYSTACMHRSDLMAALTKLAGTTVSHPSSVDPPLALYRHFVHSNRAAVMRVPDRSLFRLYRPVSCEWKAVQNPVEAKKAEERHNRCREWKSRSLAPHKALAQLAFGPPEDRDKLAKQDKELLRDMAL